jgi:soluble lytic murein transglycosylase-like protein
MGRSTDKKPTTQAKKPTAKAPANKAKSKKTAAKKSQPSRLDRIRSLLPIAVVVLLLGYFLIAQVVGNLREWVGGEGNNITTTNRYDGLYNSDRQLAGFFSDSVMYWEPAIYQWARDYGVNPNLVATVIQIESCGDPYAVSIADAQGLFQVMPVNFQEPGLNQLDPMDNARIGLNILTECLRFSTDPNFDGQRDGDPDVGLALVCYNGGPSVLNTPRNQWVNESQNYYRWGTGIWGDASQGRSSSQTLNEWLSAGGAHLCTQAETRQEMLRPLPSLTEFE